MCSATTLHAKVVFTDQPHARLLHMNIEAAISRARRCCRFTAKDVPVNEYGLTMFDQPVFIGVEHTGRSTVPCDVSRWGSGSSGNCGGGIGRNCPSGGCIDRHRWEPLPILDTIDAALNSDMLIHPENGRDSNVLRTENPAKEYGRRLGRRRHRRRRAL